MANIYDVANAAGVSISTVSHVLNGTRFVSPDTRAKVLAAIEELNYRPSSLARAMVRQETRTIGLIVPDIVNPFYADLGRGVENYGYEAGYSVLLCNSDRKAEKETAYLDMLISKRVDGVIYATSDRAEERLAPLAAHGVPVVTFDRDYAGISAIMLDNYGGGLAAARHLVELGHRRIACITGPESPSLSSDRVRGYRAALEAAGLPEDHSLTLSGNYTLASGHDVARALMQQPDPPTAIFACNDAMAIGALAALRELGLCVPGQVSIVGYDNITASAYTYPPLTTVATPIRELGEQLCQLLLDSIDCPQQEEVRRLVMHSELIVRQSTGPVPR